MKKNFVLLVLVTMLAAESSAQFKSQLKEQQSPVRGIVRSEESGLLFGWFDPNRLFMRQSYSLSYTSFGGGEGFSLGVYTNSLLYQISDPLSVQFDVSLVHSPFSANNRYVQSLSGIHLTRAQMTYRPSDSFLLQIQYSRLPMYWPNPFSTVNGAIGGPVFPENEEDR